MQLLRKHAGPRQRRNPAGHVLRLALVALALLWLAHQAFFGHNGLRALQRTEHQYAQTKAHLQALETQNRALNHSVHELQTNPDSIEAIAREQLHLTKPGEIVYTYPVPPRTGAHAAALPR
ncbi:MAG: FtsB family cell division protein [Terriglobales bacterium]